MPQEIDINFLKELQYSRKEDEVKQYIQQKESEYRRKIENAKESGTLVECTCCYSDECLEGRSRSLHIDCFVTIEKLVFCDQE